MPLITISRSEPVSGRLYLAACYLEDSVYTLSNKPTHKTSPSVTTSGRRNPLTMTTTIDYPGPHDLVVVASDGVRFNLSCTVLANTSSFFADMFTLGEPSSSTQSPEARTVNASENHVVLDTLFAISYSHPERPRPNITTFAQITELIRVADKYRMRHALDYLSSHLMIPRIQGTTISQPFTVTHSLATLSLSSTHGFSLPARLALKEAVNAKNSIWNVAFDDTTLDGFTLDFQTLRKILGLRKSRADAYKTFIQSLQPCFNHSYEIYDAAYAPGAPTPSSCATALRNWKEYLLMNFEEAPNSTAFSVDFYQGSTCSSCHQSLASRNSAAFATFIASQATEESTLPELR